MSFERQNSASNGFDPSVSFERQNSLGELEWTAQVSLIFKIQLKLFCYNLLFLLSMLPNLVLLVRGHPLMMSEFRGGGGYGNSDFSK